MFVIHSETGMRDVVCLAELHQIHGMIILHIRRFIDEDLHQAIVLVMRDHLVVEVGVICVFAREILLLAVRVVQHQIAVHAAADNENHRERRSAESRADRNGGIERVFFVLIEFLFARALAVGEGLDE